MKFLLNITPLKLFLFPILSGLLMTFSFPETGNLWLLAFVAWIPLLLVEKHYSSKKWSGFQIFLLSYLTFLVYNVGTTWWVYNASKDGAYMAFLANSLLMAVAFLLYHLLKKKLGEKWNGPLLISAWLTFEFLHFNWELSWPWLTLGNVFAKVPQLVQWYSATGVLGGSLWILLANLLIFGIIQKNENAKRNIIVLFGVILLPTFLSFALYFAKSTSGKPFHVTVVQPNIDPYNTKFVKSNEEQLNDLIALIDKNISPNSQLIVAPETALYPNGYIYEGNLRKELFNHLIHEKRFNWNNAGLLIGASTFQTFPEKNSQASQFNPNFNEWLESYNSSLLFYNSSEPEIIHKSKLVLGVEKVPFVSLFPALEELAVEMEGGSGSLGIEKGYRNFTLDSVRFTSDVCYESVYGEFVAKQTKLNSEFIAIITNDGWWGNTPGYKQHFDFARLRAIENNKYVVRAANTGKSGIINNRGDVVKETSWWKEEVFNATIQLNQSKTLYQILGDFLGYIACCSFILFALFRFYLSFHFGQNRK